MSGMDEPDLEFRVKRVVDVTFIASRRNEIAECRRSMLDGVAVRVAGHRGFIIKLLPIEGGARATLKHTGEQTCDCKII